MRIHGKEAERRGCDVKTTEHTLLETRSEIAARPATTLLQEPIIKTVRTLCNVLSCIEQCACSVFVSGDVQKWAALARGAQVSHEGDAVRHTLPVVQAQWNATGTGHGDQMKHRVRGTTCTPPPAPSSSVIHLALDFWEQVLKIK